MGSAEAPKISHLQNLTQICVLLNVLKKVITRGRVGVEANNLIMPKGF